MTEIQPSFDGSKLREKREKAGKTQVEVAKFLDITPQSYGEMERSQITPSSPNLAKLCLFFGSRIEEFFRYPSDLMTKV
jgi:DNA-binding XRE family transcriptional regulator